MQRRYPQRTRRYALQAGAAAAGFLLFAGASRPDSLKPAFAQDQDNGDDDHDDGSGHGRGRGRGRGGDGDNEGQVTAAQTAQIPPGAIEIRIVSDDAGGFVPGDLTVDPGQTVAFINTHSDEHTATGSGFDTGIIPEGGVATVVLEEAGTFRYACQIHPEMTGQIAVRDANGDVPPPATPAASPVAGAATVRIANLAFDPAKITVPAGSTVTWSNEDVTPHTATAIDGLFDSGIFDPDASFTFTFTEPGSFVYQCLLHPNMQGTIVVEGAGAGPGSPVSGSNDTVTTTQDAAGANSAAGVWMIDLIPADSTDIGPQRVLVSLQADGLVQADFAAMGAANPARSKLSDGHGTWDETDGQLSLALFVLVVDSDQRLLGTAVIQAEAPLPGDSEALNGTWSFTMNDPTGTVTSEGEGSWRGLAAPLEIPLPA